MRSLAAIFLGVSQGQREEGGEVSKGCVQCFRLLVWGFFVVKNLTIAACGSILTQEQVHAATRGEGGETVAERG